MWGKRGGGWEPTNYEYSVSGGAEDGALWGGILVISGASTTLPTNAATGEDTTSGFTFDIVALTTAVDNALDVAFAAQQGNTDVNGNAGVSFSSWGSSLVESLDSTGAAYCDAGVATAIRATAGVQAGTSVTSNDGDTSLSIRLEVEPAGGAPATVKPRSLMMTGMGQ